MGVHDVRYQWMAHHVGAGEAADRYPLHLLEHSLGVDQAAELRLGQVDLAHNPCNHGLGAKPMRVRNIFIRSGAVFCASSRIAMALFSVGPRMKASGATSSLLISRNPHCTGRCGLIGAS